MAADHWLIACPCGGHHLFIVDDMVIENWMELAEECPAVQLAIPTVQDAILRWRAKWR